MKPLVHYSSIQGLYPDFEEGCRFAVSDSVNLSHHRYLTTMIDVMHNSGVLPSELFKLDRLSSGRPLPVYRIVQCCKEIIGFPSLLLFFLVFSLAVVFLQTVNCR